MLIAALTLSLAPLLANEAGAAPDKAGKLADTYVEAVEKLNAEHLRKRKAKAEEELAERLPKKAAGALAKLLELEVDDDAAAALVRCGLAALDLAAIEDFEAVRTRLASVARAQDAQVPRDPQDIGVAVVRERFLLHGTGGLDVAYLESFASVLEAILGAYDELFGFQEWSKVPGKKLRVLIHLEEEITRPPHFAPQFPYHSQIDFPVVDPEALRSPTADGKFLFYGLCHELGHVIAMWGDR